MSKTKTPKAETMPASTHIQLTDANDPSMVRFMQGLLKKEGNVVEHIQSFTEGREKLGKPIAEFLSGLTLPVAETTDLDAQLTENNKSISEQTEAMNKATAEIDAQIAKLEAQRSEARKPFEDTMQTHREANAKLNEEKGTRVKPVIDAIQSARAELEKIADEHGVAHEFLYAYVSINSPSQPSSSSTSHSTGTGRGRGGAVQVRIAKNGSTQEFSSLNAARSSVYESIHGSEPKHGANAASCTKYLENQGYTVEIVS